MNSGATSERVYETLKWRIFELNLRPGARLDPSQLASEMSASTTPLREALQRLVGENLVETGSSEGFHVPIVTEPGLRDLYAWNSAILALAIRSVAASTPIEARGDRGAAELRASLPYPARAGALFLEIAQFSSNSEYERAIKSANDRLQAARHAEAKIDGQASNDLDAVAQALHGSNGCKLSTSLAVYHRRRRLRTAEVVRIMLRER